MNLGLNFRVPIQTLGAKIEALAARINIVFQRQHNPSTGAHTAVTAQSVVTNELSVGAYNGVAFPSFAGLPNLRISETLARLLANGEATIAANGAITIASSAITGTIGISAGGVEISIGGIPGMQVTGLITLNTGQIEFPSTQNPSGGSNTLDDYAEGSWTPELRFGGGTTGITYDTRGGAYTKIGRFVQWSFFIQLTSKGSDTGAASIAGLPFTAGSVPSTGSCLGSFIGLTFPVVPWLASSSVINMNQHDTFSVTDANFDNATLIYAAGTYYV